MKYVGIYSQQASNNTKSVLLMLLFPTIVLGLVYLFFVVLGFAGRGEENVYNYYSGEYVTKQASIDWSWVNEEFLKTLPWVVGVVGVWFIIAYFFNTAMIKHATGAHAVTRMENPRIYNIVENLTIACGMNMPKINVMDTPELNAFASGIDEKSYTVTVTTGLCNTLDDEELAGVIGHELTHIRNKDTRLLIVSIIFVGIMSTIMSLAFRFIWHTMLWGGGNRRDKNGKNEGAGVIVIALVAGVMAAIGYFFTLLTRFAVSRKREFMADAGGAELCGNPLALASALRKISGMPAQAPSGRDDIAQLYIIHPQALTGGLSRMFSNMFSTHPDTEERIRILEQF